MRSHVPGTWVLGLSVCEGGTQRCCVYFKHPLSPPQLMITDPRNPKILNVISQPQALNFDGSMKGLRNLKN